MAIFISNSSRGVCTNMFNELDQGKNYFSFVGDINQNLNNYSFNSSNNSNINNNGKRRITPTLIAKSKSLVEEKIIKL